MPVKHALGWGFGRIMEYEDGSAAYIKAAEMTQAFRVYIPDITSFGTVRQGKMMERTFQVFGSGTMLASVSVGHNVSERIEAWFRSHQLFRENASLSASSYVAVQPSTAPTALPKPAAAQLSSMLIADELTKLAGLRDQGILTEEEFAAQKLRLLTGGS